MNSMDRTQEILDVIYGCVNDLNMQLPAEGRIATEPGAVLFGDGGQLDSLAFITLLASLEDALESRLGLGIGLIDKATEDDSGEMFHTIGALARTIDEQS